MGYPSSALSFPRVPQALPRDAIAALAAFGLMNLVDRARQVQSLRPVPEWIRLSEASQESGLSVALLRRLITKGKLPAIRDGAIKVRRSDLANLDNLGGMAESLRNLKAAAGELRKRRAQ